MGLDFKFEASNSSEQPPQNLTQKTVFSSQKWQPEFQGLQIGSIRDSFHKTTTTVTSEGQAVWVDSITLGPNDYHSHLRESVRSQEQLTLPQNSTGSLRGDVLPDLCQLGLFSAPAGSTCAFRGSCITLDDLGNWSTPATGRGGPYCDVSLL
ncbi:hypothetical protein CRG98_002959 [Punica granatum]|uniref:Uncharacterized protein n=1 Tax=Punica granatum TaxID=22663 RepID=A0A2I0L7N5_PUNGR|nr:hypothetical protein CRG98_002959 [Punica granatum]